MTNKRLELVDFLKGFSIFTIVMMHLLQGFTSGMLNKALSFGGAGVHVFILCSGFGLYLSYLRKPLNYGAFLKKRFLKIYVPYILVVLVSATLPFYNTSPDKWWQLLSHIFLYKMFIESDMGSYGAQFWFLSTILCFYLFWPVIVCAFERLQKKKEWLPLVVGLAVSLAWATVVAILGKGELRIWNSFFLQFMWEFVCGMFLAKHYQEDPSFIRLPGYGALVLVMILGMGITGYAGIRGGLLKLYNDLPSVLGYLSVALILYKLLFANKLFVALNKFSYEWYLTHILAFGCVSYGMKQLFSTPPPSEFNYLYIS